MFELYLAQVQAISGTCINQTDRHIYTQQQSQCKNIKPFLLSMEETLPLQTQSMSIPHSSRCQVAQEETLAPVHFNWHEVIRQITKIKNIEQKYQSKLIKEEQRRTFNRHVVLDLQNCNTNHLRSISKTSITSLAMDGSACNVQGNFFKRNLDY